MEAASGSLLRAAEPAACRVPEFTPGVLEPTGSQFGVWCDRQLAGAESPNLTESQSQLLFSEMVKEDRPLRGPKGQVCSALEQGLTQVKRTFAQKAP